MNGRIYDPRLGMFLSPDPILQAPNNPLNYNRYSYCVNNPLKYTDPSGTKFLRTWWTMLGDFMATLFVKGGLNWDPDIRRDAWRNF